MKDPAPMFQRMRQFADIFPPHATALRAAAAELEMANEWVKPAMPEPSEAAVERIGAAYIAANRAMRDAHDAYKRVMMKEVPIPC